MSKIIILYGLALALIAFLLTWLDYRFWMRDIGFEVYGLLIAVLFGGLGVWFERHRRPHVRDNPAAPNEQAIKALGLTKRETELLALLRSGKSNKEIARDLNLSPNTVKTHLANTYEKLSVRNRTEAVTKAAELSLFGAA